MIVTQYATCSFCLQCVRISRTWRNVSEYWSMLNWLTSESLNKLILYIDLNTFLEGESILDSSIETSRELNQTEWSFKSSLLNVGIIYLSPLHKGNYITYLNWTIKRIKSNRMKILEGSLLNVEIIYLSIWHKGNYINYSNIRSINISLHKTWALICLTVDTCLKLL